LLDKSITAEEFRDDLHLLVDGCIARAGKGEQAPVQVLARTKIGVE
jgi:hypothetical protein